MWAHYHSEVGTYATIRASLWLDGLARGIFSPLAAHLRYVLAVFDYNLAMTDSSLIEEGLRCVRDICHQDPLNAALVFYPVGHSNLKAETKIKKERLLEDKLMANGLTMDHELSIHFEGGAEHAASRRSLWIRARLCMAVDGLCASPWAQSHAARGPIGPVPLVRPRDMLTVAVDRGVALAASTARPGPADRVAQRGLSANAEILKMLRSGVGMLDDDRLLVVDVVPGKISELAQTVFQLQQAHTQPAHTYLGLFVDKDSHDNSTRQLQSRLMSEWWATHPEAGPSVPSKSGAVLATKPEVFIMTWHGDTPFFSESVRARFPEGTDQHAAWMEIVERIETKFGSTRQALAEPMEREASGVPTGAGPDLTENPPVKIAESVELESKPLSEFRDVDLSGPCWLAVARGFLLLLAWCLWSGRRVPMVVGCPRCQAVQGRGQQTGRP